MTGTISGAILAGGANRRFGGITKTNQVICGKTILSRIAGITGEIFSELILVTNTPEEFKAYKQFKITGDQFKKAGPLGGIHAALKASTGEAVFVFGGDMPLLRADLILRQLESYIRIKPCNLLVPRMSGFIEPLHSIYSRSLLPSLEKYLAGNNDHAVHGFIASAGADYFDLERTEENAYSFMNVNSPADIPIVEKILNNVRDNM